MQHDKTIKTIREGTISYVSVYGGWRGKEKTMQGARKTDLLEIFD